MQALNRFVYPNRFWKIIFQNRLTKDTKCINEITKSMSTVDTKEVEHFSSYNLEWWNKNGILLPLHKFNPLRIQFVRDGLINTGLKVQNPCSSLEGIKIADVGCGAGILTESLARIGAEVTGIDASAALIAVAKEHIKLDLTILEKVNYIHTDIEEFSQKNYQLYDAVVTSEVLEHVVDQEAFLRECTRIVKPGGSIFITTVNKTALSWFCGIILAEHILKVIPAGTHDWNKFISPSDTQRILENYGCKTQLIHGILYNPLKKEWSWISNTAISYVLHAVKKIST